MPYKLVNRLSSGRLVSVWALGDLQKTYTEGETTFADGDLLELGYGLFFYENVDKFIIIPPNCELWEIEIGSRMEIPEFMSLDATSKDVVLSGSWFILKKDMLLKTLANTGVTDRIKLIKCVKCF